MSAAKALYCCIQNTIEYTWAAFIFTDVEQYLVTNNKMAKYIFYVY